MGYGEGKGKISIPSTVLALFFYVMAFGLAIAAERKISTANVAFDGMEYYCQYKANVSTGLAGFAFVFLAMAHLVVMGLTRCLCCGGSLKPGKTRCFLVVYFVICWVTWFIAEACLLAGASRNSLHTESKSAERKLSCEHIQRGIFASGAAFAFLSGTLGITYYFLFANTLDDFKSTLPTQVSVSASPQPSPYAL